MILEGHDDCSCWRSGRLDDNSGLFPSDCVIEKGTWDISFHFLIVKLIVCYLLIVSFSGIDVTYWDQVASYKVSYNCNFMNLN